MKWDIHPDKAEAYLKWTEGAIRRILALPDVKEFRAYRPAAGASQAVTTTEFADMIAWAKRQGNQDVQDILSELHTLTLNVIIELWGPSPVVPEPIQPGR